MREKICGIYSITNIVNGKRIIGQSKDIINRWYYHKKLLRHNYHDNPHLQHAWNKYKEQNFKFEVVLLCPISALNEEEIRAIKKYKSLDSNFGYNLKDGGNRPKMSVETKLKIGLANSGKKTSEETKEKLRQARLNMPEEWKQNFSKLSKLRQTGRKPSKETIQKMKVAARLREEVKRIKRLSTIQG